MTSDIRPDDGFGARNRFLTDTPPGAPRRRERSVGGLTASLGAHVVALLIAAVVVSRTSVIESPVPTLTTMRSLVYTPGGAGGDDQPQPGAGREMLARAATAAPRAEQPQREVRSPAPSFEPAQLPQREVNAGLQEAVGAFSAFATPDFGPRGGTASSGDGGPGPGGTGPGSGDGPGGGGEGQYPGPGVSWPKLIVEVKPNYTAEAMRARIEGVVELEIIVHADGTVGRIRLVRSLDARFGLDAEAIKAVRGWRFDPARYAGTPVQVRVPVEVSFRLR
jgi:periplasmic protein TonB